LNLRGKKLVHVRGEKINTEWRAKKLGHLSFHCPWTCNLRWAKVGRGPLEKIMCLPQQNLSHKFFEANAESALKNAEKRRFCVCLKKLMG